MSYKNYFFLKITKAGGTTLIDSLLTPYLKVQYRNAKPKPFILSKKEEYNDVLNNFRIPLGEYQNRRSLFAKQILYKDEWEDIFSFAISREPISRCVSMFNYLYYNKSSYINNLISVLKDNYYYSKKINFTKSYSFDVFLDLIEQSHNSDSYYKPRGLHFSTHVAKMYDDVTDNNGKIILSKIYRLENISTIVDDLNRHFQYDLVFRNKILNKSSNKFIPSKSQIKKIEQLFIDDFTIYENAN